MQKHRAVIDLCNRGTLLCEVCTEAEKQLSSSATESDPTLELSKDYKIQNINDSKDV